MKKFLRYMLMSMLLSPCVSCGNKDQTFASADFTFQMKKDKFTVINFTDTQFNSVSDIRDGTLLHDTIAYAMNEKKPDIVTFTGDNAWGGSVAYCYLKLCELMDSYEVPYFMVFGNHERENATADELASIVNSSKYGHLLKGPDDLESYGNYTIDIKNKRGRIVHRLIMMDSKDYYQGEKTYQYCYSPVSSCYYFTHEGLSYYGSDIYDNVKGKQLVWYVNQVKDIGIESTLLMHMPFIEYHYAIEKYLKAKEDNDQAIMDSMKPIGRNRMTEPVCSSSTNYGFFDLIKQYGSTKNVIVGHDHSNDYSILYQGVRLTYGLKTSSECYWYDNTMTGFTKLVIDKNGVATPEQVYYYPVS